MATTQSKIELVTEKLSHCESNTICCYSDSQLSTWTLRWGLTGDRLLAAQALQLVMRLDRELREARADWNQDRFRRVMRARSKAVSRVRRGWKSLNPPLRFRSSV